MFAAAPLIALLHIWVAPPAAMAYAGGAGDTVERPLVHQVFDYVRGLYVAPDIADPVAIASSALRSLETEYPEVITDIDGDTGKALLSIGGEERTFSLRDLDSLEKAAALVEEALVFAESRLDNSGRRDPPVYVALRGALGALDPHTRILSPAQVGDFQTKTSGSFGGVGFTFIVAEEGIRVGEILPRTPAERIGLETGDLIVAVDGVSIKGMQSEGVVQMVRGEPGTEVVLSVSREGWDPPRPLTAVREVVSRRSVRSTTLREGDVSILHLEVDRFQDATSAQIEEALDSSEGRESAGVILDLRNNPGGLLTQAVAVADIFMDSGVIVSIKDRSGTSRVTGASMFGIVRDQLPVVVLINRASASAAEVVAAALKETRAIVIGETSFGKGSVQQAYPLGDGGMLILTIRHYLTPGDVSIQARGITPDVGLRGVVVGEKIILREAPSLHMREMRLKNAFGSAQGAAEGEEPLWSVGYLREFLPSLDGSPAFHGGESGDADPMAADLPLRVAFRILSEVAGEADGISRESLIAAAAPVLRKLEAEEDRRIREALAARGINWDSGDGGEQGEPPAPALLEVELPPQVLLEAGGKATMTVRARNSGERTAFRVWGRTSSDNPLLANHDFVFGALEPGEVREATADIAVPPWAESRWDTFSLRLEEGERGGAGSFSGSARTVSGPRPSLSYRFSLEDENSGDPSLNGDGVLQGGERLYVRVSAIPEGGEPEAMELRISPDPASKVALEPPAAVLPLEGREPETEFTATLAEGADLEAFRLNLSFSGQLFGLVLDDAIDVPVGSPYPAGEERRPPRIDLGDDPPGKTDKGSMTLKVTVRDEESVRDVYVRVQGKKVFYRRNGSKTADLPVEVSVALVDGSNRIDVVARDWDGLTTAKTFFVYHVPG